MDFPRPALAAQTPFALRQAPAQSRTQKEPLDVSSFALLQILPLVFTKENLFASRRFHPASAMATRSSSWTCSDRRAVPPHPFRIFFRAPFLPPQTPTESAFCSGSSLTLASVGSRVPRIFSRLTFGVKKIGNR